jgi:putative oxidoreductase
MYQSSLKHSKIYNKYVIFLNNYNQRRLIISKNHISNVTDATLRTHRLHETVHFGLRITVGVLFIVHSIGKFDTSSKEFFSSVGLPPDMAILIGLLELTGGTLLVIGILSRISSSLLAIQMLLIMTYVKKLQAFSGKGGFEIDLLAFAMLLSIIVLGPGKISLSHIIKKVPRFLQ